MKQFLKDVAVHLYKERCGRTPADDGLPVLMYDNIRNGFWYASSKKDVITFKRIQKKSLNVLLCYLLATIVTAGMLFIFLYCFDSAAIESLVAKIWILAELISSAVLLIFFFIKKKQIGHIVFIHFGAPEHLYEEE